MGLVSATNELEFAPVYTRRRVAAREAVPALQRRPRNANSVGCLPQVCSATREPPSPGPSRRVAVAPGSSDQQVPQPLLVHRRRLDELINPVAKLASVHQRGLAPLRVLELGADLGLRALHRLQECLVALLELVNQIGGCAAVVRQRPQTLPRRLPAQ